MVRGEAIADVAKMQSRKAGRKSEAPPFRAGLVFERDASARRHGRRVVVVAAKGLSCRWHSGSLWMFTPR